MISCAPLPPVCRHPYAVVHQLSGCRDDPDLVDGRRCCGDRRPRRPCRRQEPVGIRPLAGPENGRSGYRNPVAMLLDQCTGRTWLLARGPRREFECLEVDRPGRWGFGLELE